MIGRTVAHYRILERLGGGGMGVVYKAEDTKLKRLVALKFLPSALTDNPEVRARFVLEAQAASALDHPNICAIFEINETAEGETFIAMGYYPGKNLQQRLRERPIPLAEAVEIVTKAGRGLAKAHQKGIVHRDIKPTNIILTKEGELKIIDFGLAKLTGRAKLTTTGATLGTMAYMSPEQARGEEVDHRSDIWSLGVILFEMVTGRKPFTADHPAAHIYKILYEEPPPPEKFRAGIPTQLKTIIQKALQKDPKLRYQSAEAIIADLERVPKSVWRDVPLPLDIAAEVTSGSSSGAARGGETGAEATLVESAPATVDEATVVLEQQAEVAIAVIAFADNSLDRDQEELCGGLAEGLAARLTGARGLLVADTASSLRFRSRQATADEVGGKLGVAYVLEGGLRLSASTLKLTTRLVKVEDSKTAWSDTYYGKLETIFSVVDDVVLKTLRALGVRISMEEQRRMQDAGTESPEAYVEYLRGRYLLFRRNEGDLQHSLELFNAALRADPGFAEAAAAAADTAIFMGLRGFKDPRWTYKAATIAVEKALALDETLADAHVANALQAFVFEWDFEKAEREFGRALELDPRTAGPLSWYAFFLAVTGHAEEADKRIEAHLEAHPGSVRARLGHFHMFTAASKFRRAKELLAELVELEPCLAQHYIYLSLFHSGKNDHRLLQRAVQLCLEKGYVLYEKPLLAIAEASVRNEEATEEKLSELLAVSDYAYIPEAYIAILYYLLGDDEKGFDRLKGAILQRDPYLCLFYSAPLRYRFRDDSRVDELLKGVGAPEWTAARENPHGR